MCVSLLGLLQGSNRMAESPSSLKVSTSGACEDLDMETEEEDDLRARGLNIKYIQYIQHDMPTIMALAQIITFCPYM